MSVLVVGSVALDAVETPHGKVDRQVGGAATFFSVAASFFAPVRVVAVVGDDFTAKDHTVFRGRRIDLAGLERVPGKTFFWAARYSPDMNDRETLATDLNVFADFRPRVPESFRDTQHVFLANIQPDLQLSVLRQMRRRPRVAALDTMNYWIERTPADLRATLRFVDVLFVNDSEARMLSGESNLLRAGQKILSMGPQTLLIKRGEHGALLMHGRKIFSVPGMPLVKVHDPTGAGDSFAGGFMGYLAGAGQMNEAVLRRAVVYATVMGSFAVEDFGLRRLLRLKRSEITARARQFHRVTQFRL